MEMRDRRDKVFYSQSSQVKEDPSSFTVHPEVSGGVTRCVEIHTDMELNIYVEICITSTDLLQVLVAVDELALVRVLQFVGLHVLPQSLDNDGPGLGVDPEHASQPGVQLELRGLDGSNRNVLSDDILINTCSSPSDW